MRFSEWNEVGRCIYVIYGVCIEQFSSSTALSKCYIFHG